MNKYVVLLVKLLIFGITLFFVIEEVFVCDITNGISLSMFIGIVIIVIIIFAIFGKTINPCYCKNRGGYWGGGGS